MPIAGGMYYFCYGESDLTRPPVILIHGAGGHHLLWPAEIRRLPGMRIFAPDLPGHGKSDGVGRQAVVDYSRRILDMMNELQISQAVLVGHSMGAAVALTFALDQPKRTLGLAMLAGATRFRFPPEVFDNAASAATFPLALKALGQAAFSPATDARIRLMALQHMEATRPTVLQGDLLACANFDVSNHRLSKISVPTLLVCGLEDTITPLPASEHLAAHIKSASLTKIEHAGHMLMIEKPLEIAFVLENFISKIPYQPGG